MLAEVAQHTVIWEEKRGGGRRDQDLTPVAGGGDACGAVDVVADVALLRQERRARMQAHAHR